MLAVAAFLAATAAAAAGEAPTFTVRLLTPEAALKAAQSALAKCRAQGYQVARPCSADDLTIWLNARQS